ncbi:hypothetical protein ZWY2020_042522 [Hordeum vulgare]|nr:hypothetical protein ZWY2020_042522 [Hordeum vulgare]
MRPRRTSLATDHRPHHRALRAGRSWHKHVTFLAHLLEVYRILLEVFKDADDDAGHRLNNDITAPSSGSSAMEVPTPFPPPSSIHHSDAQDAIFFPISAGHDVVPRHEALRMAARMGLDLVESTKSNPPVCKIMDFHKEKYNKDAQGSEPENQVHGDARR